MNILEENRAPNGGTDAKKKTRTALLAVHLIGFVIELVLLPILIFANPETKSGRSRLFKPRVLSITIVAFFIIIFGIVSLIYKSSMLIKSVSRSSRCSVHVCVRVRVRAYMYLSPRVDL